MSKKNKIYWFEGVTEREVKTLLSDENSKFRWLRPQRNRRILVLLMGISLLIVGMRSYWPTVKTNMNLSSGASVIVHSAMTIFIVVITLGGYLLLRISVRSIADAPDELLDERQIKIRNTSIRYAYYGMGYVVIGFSLLMFFGPDLQMFQPEGNDGSYLMIAILFAYASMPSMVMAWREQDI